jgi:hypothetical protein
MESFAYLGLPLREAQNVRVPEASRKGTRWYAKAIDLMFVRDSAARRYAEARNGIDLKMSDTF